MKIRWKTAVSVLGIATIFSNAPGWAGPPESGNPGVVPDELIVLLAPVHLGGPAPEEVVERARRGEPVPANLGVGNPRRVEFGVTHRAQGAARARLLADPASPEARLERYIVLTYPSGTDLDRVKKVLLANPHVLHVQENRIFRFSVMPSDPLMQERAFGIPLQPHEYQWGTYILNLPAAWDYAKGHSYIGVLDSGLAVSHEDLQPFSGSTFVGGNFRAHFSKDFGDADADVDEIQGTAEQGAGHGTHVSGIIAATANNGIGVAGTCWHCSLMMAKIFDDNKQYLIHEQDVVDAFRFVINKGAQAVNMSFGRAADTSCAEDAQLSMFCSAIELAERRDVTLVAASGNSRQHLQFPANDGGSSRWVESNPFRALCSEPSSGMKKTTAAVPPPVMVIRTASVALITQSIFRGTRRPSSLRQPTSFRRSIPAGHGTPLLVVPPVPPPMTSMASARARRCLRPS